VPQIVPAKVLAAGSLQRRIPRLGAEVVELSDVNRDLPTLAVPKVCLDHVEFEIGKRRKYLIYKPRIWAKSASRLAPRVED
jgi:hypothetical protein